MRNRTRGAREGNLSFELLVTLRSTSSPSSAPCGPTSSPRCGNPCLRLLRREVEALVGKERGAAYLAKQQVQTELARIDSEMRRLRAKLVAPEVRRAKLAGKVAK